MMNGVENFRDARGRSALKGRIRRGARHGLLSLLGRWSRPSSIPALRLLYCHSVFDDQRAGFAAAIDDLMHVGDFIGTKDVLGVLSGERVLTRHAFHMSFDDGQKNIVSNALPILRERAIPAILFVSTSVITNPAAFPHLQRLQFDSPGKYEHAGWSDLQRACADGFEVGSHTKTHARLSEISAFAPQMEDEIAGSKRELERRLGRCDYISWPYGGRADIDDLSLSAIERAGYHACFGAYRGRIVPGVTSRFNIPRHHFEPHWPLSHIRYFAHGAGES